MFSFFQKDPPLLKVCKSVSKKNAPVHAPSNHEELAGAFGWLTVSTCLLFFKEMIVTFKEIPLIKKHRLNEDAAFFETLTFFIVALHLYLDSHPYNAKTKEQITLVIAYAMTFVTISHPEWDTEKIFTTRSTDYLKGDEINKFISNFVLSLASEKVKLLYEPNFSYEVMKPIILRGIPLYLGGYHSAIDRVLERYPRK